MAGLESSLIVAFKINEIISSSHICFQIKHRHDFFTTCSTTVYINFFENFTIADTSSQQQYNPASHFKLHFKSLMSVDVIKKNLVRVQVLKAQSAQPHHAEKGSTSTGITEIGTQAESKRNNVSMFKSRHYN